MIKKMKKTRRVLIGAKKNKKMKNAKKEGSSRGFIPVSGSSFPFGMMMRTKHHLALAVRDDYGDIDVVTSGVKRGLRQNKFLAYPFIRGIVYLTEELSLRIFAFSCKKKLAKKYWRSKPLWRRAERKLKNLGLYLMYAIIFFGVVNHAMIRFYSDASASADLFAYNFLFTIIYFIVFVVLFALVSIVDRDELEFLNYHGAEHEVVDAYENARKINVASIRHASLLHPRCGIVVASWSVILFSLSLVFFHVQEAGFLLALLVVLGMFLISFALAYELVWASFRSRFGLANIFITPLLLVESLFVRKPRNENIEVGLVALREVLRLERNS